MSDILRGILGRARLPWLLAHHSLMGGVVLLTLQALVIHRLAGIPYPLWGPPRRSTEGVDRSDSARSHIMSVWMVEAGDEQGPGFSVPLADLAQCLKYLTSGNHER